MPEVFVGLGANLGDPMANLRTAVSRLRDVIDIEAVSSLYRSEPIGFRDQPDFLNAVLRGASDLGPRELIDFFRTVEGELGRERTVPMGPRTVDLDLLLHGDRVVEEMGVSIPHPSMCERRFVLEPLAEIAPQAVHPVSGRTAEQLLVALGEGEAAVERIHVEGWP